MDILEAVCLLEEDEALEFRHTINCSLRLRLIKGSGGDRRVVERVLDERFIWSLQGDTEFVFEEEFKLMLRAIRSDKKVDTN
jgi:hypothetical protein